MARSWKIGRLGDGLYTLLTVALVMTCIGGGGQVVLTGVELFRGLGSDSSKGLRLRIPVGLKAEVPIQVEGSDQEEQGRIYAGEARILLRHNDALIWVWQRVMRLAQSALVIWIIVLLRQILVPLLRSKPFVPENARRIRTIGAIICGWAIAAPILNYLLSRIGLSRWTVIGFEVEPANWMDLQLLGIGLMVVVLAEAFKRGSQLEDETALTV